MKKKTLSPTVKRLQIQRLQCQQQLSYLEADERAYTRGYGPVIAALRTEISQLRLALEKQGHKPYEPLSPEALTLLTKSPKRKTRT